MLKECFHILTWENMLVLSLLDFQLLIREYYHSEDEYSTLSSLKHIQNSRERLSKDTIKIMFT